MQRQRVVRPLVLVLLVLLALAPTSVAFADRPTREPYPMTGGILPDSYCGFPIRMEFLGREYIKTFVAKEGEPTIQMINGALKGTATNLDSGKSLGFNNSGPVKYISYPDGSVTIRSEGLGAYPFTAQFEPFAGYPTFFFASGLSVAKYDANGQLVSFTTTGHIEDVCAALSN